MGADTDVFEFRDYRAFLRAMYARRKATEYGFSLRAFSRRAELGSSNYLKLVMDGARNLTPTMAERFAQASGLTGDGAAYFCALVSLNQAATAGEREAAYARVRTFRRYREVHRLDATHARYFQHWYVPAIRELCARADFRDDPAWIGKLLRPTVAPSKVAEALSTLLEMGLLRRTEGGRLTQSEPLLETDEGPLPHHVATYHQGMLQRAIAAIDEVPREQREIGALTLCLSPAQRAALKERLQAFRHELLRDFESDQEAQQVVQLNFQMFPLSQGEDP